MADVHLVSEQARAVISIADDEQRLAAIVDILKAEAARRPGFGQLRVDAHRDGGMLIHIAGMAGPWHMTEAEVLRFVRQPTIKVGDLLAKLQEHASAQAEPSDE